MVNHNEVCNPKHVKKQLENASGKPLTPPCYRWSYPRLHLVRGLPRPGRVWAQFAAVGQTLSGGGWKMLRASHGGWSRQEGRVVPGAGHETGAWTNGAGIQLCTHSLGQICPLSCIVLVRVLRHTTQPVNGRARVLDKKSTNE